MKFGLRTPSLKKRISARTSWKRVVRHSMGLKAPRGMGFVTNPKKALYNKVYNKTSFSIDHLPGTKKGTSSTNTPSPKKISGSFWINLVIFLALAVFFFPLAILFLVYKLYKNGKSKEKNFQTTVNQEASETPSSLVSQTTPNNDLLTKFNIPEPTKSLIWVTGEDTSKISSPMSIKIELKIGENGVESKSIDDSYNFFSEPSIIWVRLPLQPNDDLETQKMYWPTYSGLSPIHRFQYLKWLTDVTQDTNLSYVFLYYYGLERHLLLGNYDLAVDEILRLIKYHDKGSFKSYATNALIIGSGYRKRPDILEKAPFILEELSPVSLYLQRMARKPLSAQDVIGLASRVGFTNKRYLNQYPDLFKEKLEEILSNYQIQHGDILQSVDVSLLPNEGWASMANTSIPDKVRTIKFPSVLESDTLKTILNNLLTETHLKIKQMKINKELV